MIEKTLGLANNGSQEIKIAIQYTIDCRNFIHKFPHYAAPYKLQLQSTMHRLKLILQLSTPRITISSSSNDYTK